MSGGKDQNETVEADLRIAEIEATLQAALGGREGARGFDLVRESLRHSDNLAKAQFLSERIAADRRRSLDAQARRVSGAMRNLSEPET